ncbi:MAG TPA: biotin-dependent carboxyltransferase family protein [Methylomirabilota bacterium]|nr:biotin-dependent carboxyltransferase family protein [Methylomirabilota bacterium]
MLKILEPGLLTTIQDLGRFGWYHIGMPPSGAMDNFAFRVGNLLVGNPENAAGLEMTYTGPTLEVTQITIIAVTGGEIQLSINDAPAPLWQAHWVGPGDRIALRTVTRGARAYLCVAGGIEAPLLLGSRSTYMLGRFGGLEGRKLQEGDQLPIGAFPPESEARLGRVLDRSLIPPLTKDLEVRIVMGMCSYRVKDESLADFLSATWEVSTEADRIGYRLKGPTFQFKEGAQPFGAGADPSNVVDLGYPVGSIQIPGGLEAILLMNDAVTGGGYTTIGTVIKADLDRVAQASPGGKIRFRAVSIEEALQARRAREARLAQVRLALSLMDVAGALEQWAILSAE